MQKQINAWLMQKAMGQLNGDFLVVENQWVKLHVLKTKAYGTEKTAYTVSYPKSRPISEFPTITQAMIFAFNKLAEYEQGAVRG